MKQKRYRRKIYLRASASFAALFLVVSAMWVWQRSMDIVEGMDAAQGDIYIRTYYNLEKYAETLDREKPKVRAEFAQSLNEEFNDYSLRLFDAGLYPRMLLLDENGNVVLRTGDMLRVVSPSSEAGLDEYNILLDSYFSPAQKALLFQRFFGIQWMGLEGRLEGFFSTSGQFVPQKLELIADKNKETEETIVFETAEKPQAGDVLHTISASDGAFGVAFSTSYTDRSAAPNQWMLKKGEELAMEAFQKSREWQKEKYENRQQPAVAPEDIFQVLAYGGGNSDHGGPLRTALIPYCHYRYDMLVVNGEKYHLVVGAYGLPLFRATWELLPALIFLLLLLCLLAWLTARNFIKTYEGQLALEEARRNLTNAAAHELKTPLGIIRSCSEGLMEKINEEKREHYLSVIVSETEHMDKAILDMLKVSGLSVQGSKLNLAACSLCALVRTEAARFMPMAEKKKVRIEYDLRRDFEIRCDKALLAQVVSNFLSNALRHTPPGGAIRLTVRTEKSKPFFSVENSGEILPQEALGKVWDVFYKADSARVRAEGSGLGLAICREILEKHGFAYGVKNTETGVAFWFLGEK